VFAAVVVWRSAALSFTQCAIHSVCLTSGILNSVLGQYWVDESSVTMLSIMLILC